MAFQFGSVKTCFIVGAGASCGLGFPSFRCECDVRRLCASAVARGGGNVPVSLYWSWLQRIGDYYNWDLERMYESLAHLPDLACDGISTGWVRQWLVEEIAARFGAVFTESDVQPRKWTWRKLLDSAGDCRSTAVFTTNFDLVLEQCLDRPWSDGIDGQTYDIGNFPCDRIPIVKLHGSANLVRKTLNTNCAVERRQPDPLTPAERESCLEPTRRKWPVEEPYAQNYDALEQALTNATTLVVVGFSWREEAVASVLRRALLRRKACRGDLEILVYDQKPYPVEEYVRWFLHRSGAGCLNAKLAWTHYVLDSGFPESVGDRCGASRSGLCKGTSLSCTSDWFRIEGEPCMLAAEPAGRLTFRQDPLTRYFESGRMVLRPNLPESFHIKLRMRIVRHGAGWAPGMSLEDEYGEEVLSARFIPEGKGWCLAGEANRDGLRINARTQALHRYRVPEGASVTLDITHDKRVGTTVSVRGAEMPGVVCPGPATFRIAQNTRHPTRLHLGGYPWYDDGGQKRPDAAECIIGPCTIKPL